MKRHDVQKLVSWMNHDESTVNFFAAGLVVCGRAIAKNRKGADDNRLWLEPWGWLLVPDLLGARA